MSFMESIRTVLSKYANFNGRARASEFWWYYLAFMIVITVLYVLAVIPAAVAAANGGPGQDLSPVAVIAMLLLFVVAAGLLLPTLAVTVRRLHDTDKSGFFYFMSFIPVAGGIIMLVLLAGAGTPGPNRFGPDPKAAEVPAAA
jgi:uncharacterized membrane protein YhaH (DUF805 family)